MLKKGQIVEIPAEAKIFSARSSDTSSLQEQLLAQCPPEYSLFDGILVGEHQGLEVYQLGQRKGISGGGHQLPLYVIAMDATEDRLFVGAGSSHPGLDSKVFKFQKNRFFFTPEYDDSLFSLEAGVEVQVISEALGNTLDARMFSFGSEFFLQFPDPVSITIQNHQININYQNQNIIKIL